MIETYANNARSQLNGGINNSTLTITVDNGSSFPSTGFFRIIIDSEIIYIKSRSGNVLTAQSRGYEGTIAASHLDDAQVVQLLTKGALDTILDGPIGSEDTEGKGIFLLACHKSTDELIHLLASNDGKTFHTIKRRHIFTPGSGNQRDPSLLYWNDKYWLAHTNSTNTYWTLLSSSDLLEWTSVANVDMTSIATVHRVWAPEFFIDDDNTVRVFTTCSTGGVTTNFQIYEQHATADDLSTWSAPVIITGTSLRANMIDAFCIKIGSTYNIWYKDDDTKFIEYISSTSLTSGYTKTEIADWAGWGTGLEAPYLVKMSATKWRIYLNENTGLDSVAVYWSDSTDDWATWTSKLSILSPWPPAHPSVLRVRDFNTLRHIYAIQQDSWRAKGASVKVATTFSVPDNTGTAVTFDTEDKDESDFWASGAPTRFTADAAGWYLINWKARWASSTVGKRVVDIRLNGGSTLRGSQSTAPVTANQIADMSGSALFFLTEDDYVEMIAFQNTGGALNLSVAIMDVVALA